MSDSSQNCPWVAIWVFWLLVPKGSNEDGWGPLENSLSVAQCLRTFVWYCMWTSLSLYRFIVYLDIHVVHQIGKVFIFVSWNSIALFFSFPVFFCFVLFFFWTPYTPMCTFDGFLCSTRVCCFSSVL